MMRPLKMVLGSAWMVVVCSAFAVFIIGAIYFAWEEGWFQFALAAVILSFLAAVVAGAINYWSERQ